MVFELAVGQWESARDRFTQHVLPVVDRDFAPTDAPSALWRLQLARPEARLPWAPVHANSVRHFVDREDPYALLHDLLALCGAGDVARLDAWAQVAPVRVPRQATLRLMAFALARFAAEDYRAAAEGIEEALPHIPQLGGSRAQNELFAEILTLARVRSHARGRGQRLRPTRKASPRVHTRSETSLPVRSLQETQIFNR
jgi:hypothetical protein